jgi:hypothetical protein
MPGPAIQPVTVVDVRDSGSRYIQEFYRQVMVPSFPPDELLDGGTKSPAHRP